MNKEQFLNLDLTSDYLINDSTAFFKRSSSKRGYGTYEYKFKESCASEILYQVKVKLPVVLNGDELSVNKQEEILSKIPASEIVSIKRKSSFFGRGKIYIETTSH